MSLVNELKRRNVFRVGIAYLVAAWLIMQVADIVINTIGAPGWVFQVILLILGIGFPVALTFAWAFELTPDGLKKEKDVDRSQSIQKETGGKLNYEARTALYRALELAPDNPNTYSDMADLAMDTGDLTAALDWSRQAIEKDPQDHELVAGLADRLFVLGLAEEGGRWASRCYALAPQTAVCRRLQLVEARTRNEPAKSLELATAMLRDDVSLRRFGFTTALFAYVDLMTDQGHAKEAFDYLVSLYPGTDDHERKPGDFKTMMTRQAGVELMWQFAPEDEYLIALELMDKQQREAKLPWLDRPRWRIERHLMRGETEQARVIAINEDLPRNIPDSLDLRYRFATPMYRELSQLPEIAATLGKRNTELAALRSDVETMMLEPEWNQ